MFSGGVVVSSGRIELIKSALYKKPVEITISATMIIVSIFRNFILHQIRYLQIASDGRILIVYCTGVTHLMYAHILIREQLITFYH
jgi:hypothetical protein